MGIKISKVIKSKIKYLINKIFPFFIEYLPAILFLFITLVTWELIVRWLNIPIYILPRPTTIISRIIIEKSMLFFNLKITMIAAMGGFLIGGIVAFMLAVSFLYSKTTERAIYPWAIMIKSIPIVAIAPLLTIWLGYGMAPKVVIAAVVSFFPILVNATQGLQSIDYQAMEFLQLLGATKWEIFLKLRFPSSLPYLFSSFKISVTIAVIGAIVAEFTGSEAGIGSVIIAAGYRLDSPLLFASIFMSSFASICMFYVIVLLEKVCIYWPKDKGKE